MKPKVSVIIPYYNVEPYIERCARSLFEQTLDDIEYIFINDCSPDKSKEVLLRVLEDYPSRKEMTRLFDMPINSGQAVATRLGISKACGEYLIRCDADDCVDTDMFRAMYEKCLSDNYDMVVCDKLNIKDNHRTLIRLFMHEYPDGEYRERYLRNILDWHGSPTLSAMMVKHSVFNNEISFPEKRMGEDTTLLIQLAYYSSNIGYLPKPLYFYYYNPTSTCNTLSEPDCFRRLDEYSTNYGIIFNFLLKKGVADRYPKELEALKHHIRMCLGPVLNSKENIKYWMTIFPEIRWSVLFNSHLSIISKKVILSKMIRFYMGI